MSVHGLLSLGELERIGAIRLYRGKVISKNDIRATPGSYPIYSSSVQNGGLFGRYGIFMFDEEMITWSVDGGGHFFYRPKHKFSVTNVCGYMRVLSKDIDIRYLAYALQYLHSKLHFDYTLKAHPSVIRGAYHLEIPSILEQRSIASAIADADDLIATLERLIAKKQAIKQGMMQQLLTGRTRLPGFTGEWADIRLGDHVSYVKTVALSRAQLDTKSPLKYLHYGDIHTRSSVILDSASEEMPRASAKLAARAGLLQCGDLVFADASEDPAGVGKSVEIVSTPNTGVVPGLHTIAARFDKSVLADGFKAYLQFIPSFRDQLLRLAAGTKVLATTRSYISSITLTLPGVAEQKAIAEALHDSEREIEALRVRLSKAQSIKTGMMQQLLTGRSRLPVEAAS
ncbi:restriction endonuclease subunit S [Nocardia farcinica]|uniref:restriction endonuclease subunit S n=1 Tax=Nocardia farcinica TaxID=37329 RepID=UPI002457613E|nr:restriction endonuclease subunit S [Nocardia farcinica]